MFILCKPPEIVPPDSDREQSVPLEEIFISNHLKLTVKRYFDPMFRSSASYEVCLDN